MTDHEIKPLEEPRVTEKNKDVRDGQERRMDKRKSRGGEKRGETGRLAPRMVHEGRQATYDTRRTKEQHGCRSTDNIVPGSFMFEQFSLLEGTTNHVQAKDDIRQIAPSISGRGDPRAERIFAPFDIWSSPANRPRTYTLQHAQTHTTRTQALVSESGENKAIDKKENPKQFFQNVGPRLPES